MIRSINQTHRILSNKLIKNCSKKFTNMVSLEELIIVSLFCCFYAFLEGWIIFSKNNIFSPTSDIFAKSAKIICKYFFVELGK